ncbi:MAG: putative peptidoglycan glycosyltransferase FtsW [Verrucomicrobiota bacterium]
MRQAAIYLVVVAVCLLVGVGCVTLTSTGVYTEVARKSGNPYHNVERQVLHGLLGLCLAAVAALVDYRWWIKFWPWLLAVTLGLLGLCFVEGIGQKINGERRWISLLGLTFQPSEIGKLTGVVVLAAWFGQFAKKSQTFLYGILFPGLFVGSLGVLILMEVDMGTTATLAAAAGVMIYLGGARLRYLVALLLLGSGVVWFMVSTVEEDKMVRIEAWKNPEAHADGSAYQPLRAKIALENGGLHGRGIGASREKRSRLPFAHTDFIFPIIAEELGLWGSLGVVAAFVTLAVAGFLVALNSEDRVGKLLGCGLITIICLQAALNIAVTTSAVPNTGLPLPFISYGGTSLVIHLVQIGILVSIFRFGSRGRETRHDWLEREKFTPRI